MVGSAVLTTRLSSVTMNSATLTIANVQPARGRRDGDAGERVISASWTVGARVSTHSLRWVKKGDRDMADQQTRRVAAHGPCSSVAPMAAMTFSSIPVAKNWWISSGVSSVSRSTSA